MAGCSSCIQEASDDVLLLGDPPSNPFVFSIHWSWTSSFWEVLTFSLLFFWDLINWWLSLRLKEFVWCGSNTREWQFAAAACNNNYCLFSISSINACGAAVAQPTDSSGFNQNHGSVKSKAANATYEYMLLGKGTCLYEGIENPVQSGVAWTDMVCIHRLDILMPTLCNNVYTNIEQAVHPPSENCTAIKPSIMIEPNGPHREKLATALKV